MKARAPMHETSLKGKTMEFVMQKVINLEFIIILRYLPVCGKETTTSPPLNRQRSDEGKVENIPS